LPRAACQNGSGERKRVEWLKGKKKGDIRGKSWSGFLWRNREEERKGEKNSARVPGGGEGGKSHHTEREGRRGEKK